MYSGFFVITEREHYAAVRCAPAFNDVFIGHALALFDHDEKAWTIPLGHLEELITWLRERGHDVAVIRRHPTLHPHGKPQIPEAECGQCGAPFREQLLTTSRLGLGPNPDTRCPGCGHELYLTRWDNIANAYEPPRPEIA